MNILSDFNLSVDPDEVQKRVETSREAIPGASNKDLLKRIFGLIDLTTLSERDNIENVSQLCEKVNQLAEAYPSMPNLAAICVYPELVSVVKEKLDNPLISIASVGGGFPASQTFTNIKVMEIEQAIEQGAEEIDLVIPVGKFLMDDLDYVDYEIQVIKQRNFLISGVIAYSNRRQRFSRHYGMYDGLSRRRFSRCGCGSIGCFGSLFSRWFRGWPTGGGELEHLSHENSGWIHPAQKKPRPGCCSR